MFRMRSSPGTCCHQHHVPARFPCWPRRCCAGAADRKLGCRCSPRANGGAILCSTLFWFFGTRGVHRRDTFFGIATEIVRCLPQAAVRYKGMVGATLGSRAVDDGGGAPHVPPARCCCRSSPSCPSSSPSRRDQVLQLDRTMWPRPAHLERRCCSPRLPESLPVGGLTGVILASRHWTSTSATPTSSSPLPLLLFATVVFTMSAVLLWWPKFTGKSSGDARKKFWTLFTGFWMTFLCSTGKASRACPRRVANYPDLPAAYTLNQISSIGSFILGVSTLFFSTTCTRLAVRGAGHVDDPWGYANSLEWATSCPRHAQLHQDPRSAPKARVNLHHPGIQSGRTRTRVTASSSAPPAR